MTHHHSCGAETDRGGGGQSGGMDRRLGWTEGEENDQGAGWGWGGVTVTMAGQVWRSRMCWWPPGFMLLPHATSAYQASTATFQFNVVVAL